MNILAIIGSPRKGNTYRVTKQIEEHINTLGHVEFHDVFLKDINLKPCLGCFQCVQKGEKFCPLDDDKEMLLHHIMNADGVILATPAYNFNVTALMKNFIDRFAYNGHQPQFFHQHAMIVVTTAGTGLKEVNAYLTKYVAKSWGFRSFTSVGVLTPPYQIARKLIEQDQKKIQTVSETFFQNIDSQTWSPRYYHLEQFCTMRAIFTLEGMREAFPADYTFYTSLWNKKFYVHANINVFKYALACIQAQLVKLLIKTFIKPEVWTENEEYHVSR